MSARARASSRGHSVVALPGVHGWRKIRTIDHAFKRLQSDQATAADSEKGVEGITRLAQAILKREWQDVKSGT